MWVHGIPDDRPLHDADIINVDLTVSKGIPSCFNYYIGHKNTVISNFINKMYDGVIKTFLCQDLMLGKLKLMIKHFRQIVVFLANLCYICRNILGFVRKVHTYYQHHSGNTIQLFTSIPMYGCLLFCFLS